MSAAVNGINRDGQHKVPAAVIPFSAAGISAATVTVTFHSWRTPIPATVNVKCLSQLTVV